MDVYSSCVYRKSLPLLVVCPRSPLTERKRRWSALSTSCRPKGIHLWCAELQPSQTPILTKPNENARRFDGISIREEKDEKKRKKKRRRKKKKVRVCCCVARFSGLREGRWMALVFNSNDLVWDEYKAERKFVSSFFFFFLFWFNVQNYRDSWHFI